MPPIVSVIVPVYDSKQYLQECVQSVLAQSFVRFELLLIDDGSSDGSRAICEGMRKADARVRYLQKEHRGVAAARNAGIKAAKGTYLFFLDSDDVIHPQLLETLFQLLESHHLPMATEEFLHTPSTANLSQQWSSTSPADRDAYTLLPGQRALDCFISDSPIKGLGGIGGQMIRRDMMQSVLFDTALSCGEDTKLIYQLLSKGAGMIVLGRKWYCYRTHAGQSSRLMSFRAWQSTYECQTYIRDRELEAGRVRNAVIREGMLLTSLAAWYAQSRRAHDAERIESLWQMVERERRWAYFSQVAFSARLSFYLARRFLPLYLLAHSLWLRIEKMVS